MHVLVVDDSDIVRGKIRKILEPAGLTVRESESAGAACQLLQNERFDVVTLDIQMPGMDGYSFCKQFRDKPQTEGANSRFIPIVMVTSDDTLEGRIKGFEAGATEFVTKSKLDSELLPILWEVLEPARLYENLTVLLAQDAHVIRTLVRSWLKPVGVSILDFDNGLEAYHKLQERPDRVGLVLLGVELPGMRGDELCHKMRRELGMRNTPVICLSSNNDMARRLRLFHAGVSDYLVHPLPKEEFVARVQAQLKVSAYMKRQEGLLHG